MVSSPSPTPPPPASSSAPLLRFRQVSPLPSSRSWPPSGPCSLRSLLELPLPNPWILGVWTSCWLYKACAGDCDRPRDRHSDRRRPDVLDSDRTADRDRGRPADPYGNRVPSRGRTPGADHQHARQHHRERFRSRSTDPSCSRRRDTLPAVLPGPLSRTGLLPTGTGRTLLLTNPFDSLWDTPFWTLPLLRTNGESPP